MLDLSFNILNLKFDSQLSQLYHPTSSYRPESQDIVYSKDTINQTKFIPILLKEWFFLVKKGGLLVIDYKPNKIAGAQEIENYMNFLWNKKFNLIYKGKVSDNETKELSDQKIKDFINDKRSRDGNWQRIIFQKTESSIVKGDDISKWTFGIITNGRRNDWVKQIIESIKLQKIPHYQIIICGTYTEKLDKDIEYIYFNKNDEKGWITKKKNLIVKRARYENICMLHDRIVLEKNWYGGMKKWGNCFENLGCCQLFNNQRVNDWLASHYFIESSNGERFSFESYVDYKDWYSTIFFLGQINIFKKSIITKNNLWWDEKLFYGQREDVKFSLNFHKQGFIHRFNPYSSVRTLTNKYISPTYIKYSLTSKIPQVEISNIQAFFKLGAFLLFKTLNILHISLPFKTLENIRGKIYTFILMFNPTKYSFNREWRRVIK